MNFLLDKEYGLKEEKRKVHWQERIKGNNLSRIKQKM